MPHSEEHRKNLSDIAVVLKISSNEFECLSSVTIDEELKMIYGVSSTSEYDEIREIIEKQKENIVNILIPIKEACERSAEYENFGKKKTSDKD